MGEEIYGGGAGGGGVLNIAGGSNITISSSGGSITINGGVNTGATTFLAGVGSLGNTLGTTGLVNLQNYLVGGTNVTLSQSTNGQSATISFSADNPFKAGVSSGGNTLGQTKTISNQIVFVGGSNITLSQGTAAGGATITVIGPAPGTSQSAQTGISSIQASDATYTSGKVIFTGAGAVTVSSGTGQQVIINAPVQSAQPEGTVAFGVSSGGNTLGTTGLATGTGPQLVFVGGSNITLSQSLDAGGSSGTVTIIGGAGGSGGAFLGVAGSGASTVTNNVVQFANQNGVSFGLTGSTMTASFSGGTGGGGIAASLSGNSTSGGGGYALISSGTLILAGGNNITLSQDGQSVTISAPSGGGAGVSSGGNTLGTTGTVDYQLVFVGGNNITLSESINGSSGTITIMAPDTFQHPNITLAGNSTSAGAGYIQISSGVMTLAGGTNITLSQNGNAVTVEGAAGGGVAIGDGVAGVSSGTVEFVNSNGISFGLSGSTMTASFSGGGGGGGTLSQWMPPGMGYSSFTQQGQSSLVMFPAILDANLSASRADFYGSVSVNPATNSSQNATLSLYLGVYTRNVSTLSLASSGSVSYSWNLTGATSSGSLVGLRDFSVPINVVMTPGNYWMGALSATSVSGGNMATISNLQLAGFATAYSGPFLGATNATNQFVPGLGVFSAQTAALPASVAFGDLIASSASTARPVVNFLNFTA